MPTVSSVTDIAGVVPADLVGLVPARESSCVARLVFKGIRRGFEVSNGHMAWTRSVDRIGRPYIEVSVPKCGEVAHDVLANGKTLSFVACPACGREHIRLDSRQEGRIQQGIGRAVNGARKHCRGCGESLKNAEAFSRRYVTAEGVSRAKDGSTFFLFEETDVLAPRTPQAFRERLGIAAVCGNEADEAKFPKYYRRFVAPVMATLRGRVTRWLPNGSGFEAFVVKWNQDKTCLERLNVSVSTPDVKGKELALSGRVVNSDVVYDGWFPMSVRLAEFASGRPMQHGDGLQASVACPLEFHKGFGVVMKNLVPDLVLYMGKRQLVTVDDAFELHIMLELTPSKREYTDIQSVEALNQAETLEGHAISSMIRFEEALNDTKRVNGDIQAMVEQMTKEDLDDNDDPAWSLLQAYLAGLPVNVVPGMRRRLVTFYKTEMLNMRRGRVPLPSTYVGGAIVVDITAFDNWGILNPELAQLGPGTVAVPAADNIGPIAMFRRPIANQLEQWFALQVKYPALCGVSASSPFIFMSVFDVDKSTAAMGFCDFDDHAQLCQEREEVLRRMEERETRPYPIATMSAVELASEMPCDEDAVKWEAAKVDPFERHFEKRRLKQLVNDPFVGTRQEMARAAQRKGVSIGSASNAIIVDSANWNNGRYPVPMLFEVSSILPQVIDGNVHVVKEGEADTGGASGLIRKFVETVPCCPREYKYRLPGSQRERVEFYDGGMGVARKKIEVRQAQFLKQLWKQGKELIESAVPHRLRLVEESRDGLGLLWEMQEFWKQRELDNDARVRPDIEVEYRDAGEDLNNPDVKDEIEEAVGIDSFKLTQRDLFAAYDGNASVYQAVAIAMKQSYVQGRGSDGMFCGNHTVSWLIKVWQALEAGGDKLVKLGLLVTDTDSLGVFGRGSRRTLDDFAAETVVSAVTVSEGWAKRGYKLAHAEVQAWLACEGQNVAILPAKLNGRDAFEVVLADSMSHYAWVLASHAGLLQGRDSGVLRRHPDPRMPFAMQVVLGAVPPEPGDDPGSAVVYRRDSATAAVEEVSLPVFTVVDGQMKKHGEREHPEVVRFRAQAGKEVIVVHCLHLSEEDGTFEDAALVMAGAGIRSADMWHACMLDGEVIDAFEDGAYVGYLTRPDVARFKALGVQFMSARLQSGGDFSLRAVVYA